MKTFKQFQEAAISVPAIVGASKYIIPALMTGIGAAGTIKGGSKLLPKLMTGIGAAGTLMQIKKKKRNPTFAKQKLKNKQLGNTNKPRTGGDTYDKTGLDTSKIPQSDETGIIKPTNDIKADAAAKRLENIRNNKLYKNSNNPKDPNYLEKVLKKLRKEEVAIANSMGGGGIAGSVEADDEPPVNKEKKKKKKTYAYGGRGSRKMWMT